MAILLVNWGEFDFEAANANLRFWKYGMAQPLLS